ncbi:MAG: dephospho-CoA kinase [Rikenellaceae bacterium]|nr:dephospho-CoA kinase [Rikenellaceae bacterium]
MIRVGITGGIGSGKSTVCRLFEQRGVAVYDSDSRARLLMDSDGDIRRELTALFGEACYREGRLDRAWLSARVFADRSLLAALDGVVHPAVGRDFRRWAEERCREGARYVLLESAILFESGFDSRVDFTVTVSAPQELRIARCMARDGSDREAVLRRMAHQMSDRERERRADWTIVNESMEELTRQVGELDAILRHKTDRGE